MRFARAEVDGRERGSAGVRVASVRGRSGRVKRVVRSIVIKTNDIVRKYCGCLFESV